VVGGAGHQPSPSPNHKKFNVYIPQTPHIYYPIFRMITSNFDNIAIDKEKLTFIKLRGFITQLSLHYQVPPLGHFDGFFNIGYDENQQASLKDQLLAD
jgi:hypothetical protein